MTFHDYPQIERTLSRLSLIASDDDTAFWVAELGDVVLAVDARFPRHAMAIEGKRLVPLEVVHDVRHLARWYVAPDEMILDLRS